MTQKNRITLERTFDAPIEDVWELWTTKEGIESWWGPEGFHVEVRSMDLRPGGILKYAMVASAPGTIEFMKKQGMPTVTEATIRYTEVIPHARLAYLHAADFIPNVPSYDVATVVEIEKSESLVRMRLTFDAMHDEVWTQRQRMGWESEIGKLAKVIASRRV